MAQDNNVTVTGNVTRDPELRFTPNGAAVAEFGLAWNQRRKVGDEWEDQAHFFDVTVWLDTAEHVAESIKKGARVTVAGRLDQSSWEDKDTGDKRSKVRIVADEVSPSLRWATADVHRISKDGGGGGSSSGRSRRQSDDGGGRSGGGGSSRRDDDYGQEPF